MWAFMVVLVHPLGCKRPHLFQVIPVILRQPFVSDRPIEPLNESIVGHGPFVMNTRAEIVQAIQDFQQGKFGQIVDQS